MTSQNFVNNFGGRVLRFIESKTKEPLEQKQIRDLFYSKFGSIFNTQIVDEIIEEGKIKAANALAVQLKSEINDRQEKLRIVEERISKKKRKVEDMFNEDEDQLFSQVTEFDVGRTPTSQSGSTPKTNPTDNKELILEQRSSKKQKSNEDDDEETQVDVDEEN